MSRKRVFKPRTGYVLAGRRKGRAEARVKFLKVAFDQGGKLRRKDAAFSEVSCGEVGRLGKNGLTISSNYLFIQEKIFLKKAKKDKKYIFTVCYWQNITLFMLVIPWNLWYGKAIFVR